MRTVYRYLVPVDDQPHEIELRGPLLTVGCRAASVVEFWAWHDESVSPSSGRYQVFGTGHKIPSGSLWCGTVVAPGGQLVWHLFELGGAS